MSSIPLPVCLSGEADKDSSRLPSFCDLVMKEFCADFQQIGIMVVNDHLSFAANF